MNRLLIKYQIIYQNSKSIYYLQSTFTGQCWCVDQSNYFATIYISASETSDVAEIIANPPIQVAFTSCK